MESYNASFQYSRSVTSFSYVSYREAHSSHSISDSSSKPGALPVIDKSGPAQKDSLPVAKDAVQAEKDKVTIGSKPADAGTYGKPPAQIDSHKGGAIAEMSSLDVNGSKTRSTAANTVLELFEARLQSEAEQGASKEQLEVRLKEGLEGFIEGFDEAYKQLKEVAALYPEVESAIEGTYSDVLEGVSQLAEAFDIDTPVTNDMVASQEARRAEYAQTQPSVIDQKPTLADVPAREKTGNITTLAPSSKEVSKGQPAENAQAKNLGSLLSASTFNMAENERRSFDFSLKTRDGDTVNIRSVFTNISALSGSKVAYGGGEGHSLSGVVGAQSGFVLDIRGDIDEEEYRAIEDLMMQVKQVSDSFFSGDIEAAFEYAMEVGFDTDEIVEFSLSLRSETITVYESEHVGYSKNGRTESDPLSELRGRASGDLRLQNLADFVEQLENMRQKAESLGISGFSEQLQTSSYEAKGVKPFVAELMGQLEQRQLNPVASYLPVSREV